MKAARRAWGFTGYVTSDSDAVGDIYTAHHYAKTAAEASCLAIKNGQCDIDSGNTFYNGLLEGVKAGNCSMDDVDGAVGPLPWLPTCLDSCFDSGFQFVEN